MQSQGIETDGIPFKTGISACVQALDAVTMAAEVASQVATIALAQPNSLLIDLDLAGGGSGGAFMCTLLSQNGSGGTPANIKIQNLVFHWFEAIDAASLAGKMNIYRATLGSLISLWAWDVTGSVGKWIGVFVTWNNNPG